MDNKKLGSEMTSNEKTIDTGNLGDTIQIKREDDIKLEPEIDDEIVESGASADQSIKIEHELEHSDEYDVDPIYCSLSLMKKEFKDEFNKKGVDKTKPRQNDNLGSGKKQKKKKCSRSDGRSIDKTNKKPSNPKKMKNKCDGKKPMKQHKCDSCEFMTKYKSQFKRHLLKHTGERPFGCNHCEKRYTSKQCLQEHMKIHVDEFLFHCSMCLQEFEKKSDKCDHEAICKKLRYECHLCKNSFGSKKIDLVRHMPTHTGKRAFQCKECFKQFSRRDNLNIHIKMHAGPRPFRCSICYERFSQQNEKDQHEGTCNRQTYECYACRKSFGRNKFHLKRHMGIHTGERPFKCQQCPKRFNQKSNLNQHKKVHAKKPLPKCVKCRKDFRNKIELKDHQNQCNRRGYECFLCKKLFGYRKNRLELHIVQHSTMQK